MAYAKKNGTVPAGDMSALRQHGRAEFHPGDCPCRRCRRMRVVAARRKKPRYGQDTLPAAVFREEEP